MSYKTNLKWTINLIQNIIKNFFEGNTGDPGLSEECFKIIAKALSIKKKKFKKNQ